MDPRRDDPMEDPEGGGRRDEPDVVPAISSEQPPIATDVGVGAYVGRTEESESDNDQDSHVSPPDNDGETVPQDEVRG